MGSVFCAHINQNHNKPSRRYSHSGLLWPLVMATSAQLGGAQTSQDSLLDSQLKTDAFTPILYKEVLWNYCLRWVFVLFCCCFAYISFASVVLTQKPSKSTENGCSLAYISKAAGEPVMPASRDFVPSEETHFFPFLRPSQTTQMLKHFSLWETFPIQTTPVPNLRPARFYLKILQ